MSRWRPLHFVSLAAVASVLLALWLVEISGFSGRAPRNLILISIDTLRADHLGSYGYPLPTSPRLDRFAERGAVFRNAFSPAGWTVPSHMSAFTGLEPAAHRLFAFPDPGRLGDGYVTLAETLRDKGFETAAFTGGGFMSPHHGFEDGFERFTARGRHFDTKLADVRQWIESVEANAGGSDEEPRFFAFLHGFDVHRPYRPPEAYARRWAERAVPGAGEGRLVADRLFPLLEDLSVLAKNRGDDPERIRERPSDEDLALAVSQYDAEIERVDDLLGEFLEWLDAKGLLSETLVVVFSDHGDEFYEHGSLDHVHTLYDELLRVAWFMLGPGVPRETVVRRPVSLVDVMPTVCDLLNVPLAAPVQGRSRVGALDEEPDAPRGDDALYAFGGYSEFPYRMESVRTGKWKLHRWLLSGMKAAGPAAGAKPPFYSHQFRRETEDFVELFDVEADPGEKSDVAAENPDVVKTLEEMLDGRLEESASLAREPGERPKLTREYIEELKSLGYLR